MIPWYKLSDPDQVPSPALLVYPEGIKLNIQEMIRVAGGPSRLRPHVKTHKCKEIVSMQQDHGIAKFKCATVAEAEMLAECKVKDILMAYQPCGPNTARWLQLIKKFKGVTFGALVDNKSTIDNLEQLANQSGVKFQLFIDLDVGMHRTGISPDNHARQLADYLKKSEKLIFRGWHVYDGHIRDQHLDERKQTVETSFEAVSKLISEDSDAYEIVAGGSPTFPLHALNQKVDLSPGTSLLWDHGYSQMFPDQSFNCAAVLLTRVISKPHNELLCLDLGHKSVASEMPHPRVYFPEMSSVEFVSHSEEHLVIRTSEAAHYQVGDAVYGIPMHICPTVALHQELVAIAEGKVIDKWKVFARDRRISV